MKDMGPSVFHMKMVEPDPMHLSYPSPPVARMKMPHRSFVFFVGVVIEGRTVMVGCSKWLL